MTPVERALAVYDLYWSKDMTYAKIGAQMGFSAERARQLVQRGHQLKRAIASRVKAAEFAKFAEQTRQSVITEKVLAHLRKASRAVILTEKIFRGEE